ncbi:12458_t:CDS:2 [Cetraspora pellucida]|uniref:12458_t:CDS:1 n=1 Tax=Cetraspora pellucida TaxID=1433469 RepID=A0ACA9MAY8_9GLOM|nr:12458_t:CDS:2 [Cetraspora pellucida]
MLGVVLARKKAVVDLIEGLVASDTGGNGSKLTCPNCNQKFDALPFEYNGKKYHSQQCADEAKQKEKDQGGGGPDQNQGIDQTRTAAIQDINNALGEDPKIATNINDLRDKVLTNIKKKRKEKQTEEQINKEGEGIDEATGQDLINKIKKVEIHEENAENTKELIKDIVEAAMTKRGVSEDELGVGEKELFTKIKNKEINDKDQLKTAKNTLVEFIGNKDAEKRIDNLRKEVEAARNSDQKNAVREKLKKLKIEDNIYVKKRAADIEKLLEKLESNTDETSGNNKPGIP